MKRSQSAAAAQIEFIFCRFQFVRNRVYNQQSFISLLFESPLLALLSVCLNLFLIIPMVIECHVPNFSWFYLSSSADLPLLRLFLILVPSVRLSISSFLKSSLFLCRCVFLLVLCRFRHRHLYPSRQAGLCTDSLNGSIDDMSHWSVLAPRRAVRAPTLNFCIAQVWGKGRFNKEAVFLVSFFLPWLPPKKRTLLPSDSFFALNYQSSKLSWVFVCSSDPNSKIFWMEPKRGSGIIKAPKRARFW